MKKICGIWLPDNDTHFANHLHKEPLLNGRGTYQWKKLNAAVEVLPFGQRGLAVDIGAHVGLWSHVLATMFAEVVAFEPIPDHYACWARNCSEIENVQGYNMALSDTDGYLDIVKVAENSGNARVATSSDKKESTCRVRAYALDNFPLEEKIDFMKIDVEGWELQVLKGAEKTIRRDKPVMVVEQKPNNAERYGQKRMAAVDLLVSWGYTIVWEKAGDYCVKSA
jgi:FkbM family methyltransferase